MQLQNPKTAIPFLALISIVCTQTYLGGYTFLATAGFVIFIGYLQNASYSLQSRSRLRDSNLYHAIAALVASLVYFSSLRFLIRNQLSLLLLPAYILGTTAGSLNGSMASLKIEKYLGLSTVDPSISKKSQLARFWPTIIFLGTVLGIQIAVIHSQPISILLILSVLAILDNFLFSILSIARNKDNYWFHLVAILVHSAIRFLSFKILVGLNMDWVLFLPQLTGSIIGSISGTEFSKVLSKWIKASYDNHVTQDGSPVKAKSPAIPTVVLLSCFALQFYLFGFLNIKTILVLAAAALIQSLSFSISSRARQRNDKNYIVYASLFSNGVWYFTMNQLALNKLPSYKLLPYMIGTSVGSLLGQNLAIKIEKIIGAVMNISPVPTQPIPAK